MAILTDFPGLEVDITVDEVALEEYPLPADSDENVASGTVIQYIEAAPGAKFAARLCLNEPFEYLACDMRLQVTVDGIFSYSSVILKEKHADGLVTTVKDRLKGLGLTVVKMQRVKMLGPNNNNDPNHYRQDEDTEHGDIPEKALKGRAISRRTKLGNAVPASKSVRWTHDWIDAQDEPFALFTFRYRSMDDLHAELIVPMPVPLEERDVDTLTLEELRELTKRQQERLKASESQSGHVKREVKREHNAAFGESSGTSKRRRTETIDLTDD